MKKKYSFVIDSETVPIISIYFNGTILLRKPVYCGFRKEPETPKKWHKMKIKSVYLKAPSKRIITDYLEKQRKSLFCMEALMCLLFSLLIFFFPASKTLGQNIEIFKGLLNATSYI